MAFFVTPVRLLLYSGSEDAAARSSAELNEPRRVLPEIPMMLTGGTLLRQEMGLAIMRVVLRVPHAAPALMCCARGGCRKQIEETKAA